MFGRVVCDEAQKLKHLSILAYKSVKDLRTAILNTMTAISMMNKPSDLEGILDSLFKDDWRRNDLEEGQIPAIDEYGCKTVRWPTFMAPRP